jgi:hypothetical protein
MSFIKLFADELKREIEKTGQDLPDIDVGDQSEEQKTSQENLCLKDIWMVTTIDAKKLKFEITYQNNTNKVFMLKMDVVKTRFDPILSEVNDMEDNLDYHTLPIHFPCMNDYGLCIKEFKLSHGVTCDYINHLTYLKNPDHPLCTHVLRFWTQTKDTTLHPPYIHICQECILHRCKEAGISLFRPRIITQQKKRELNHTNDLAWKQKKTKVNL